MSKRTSSGDTRYDKLIIAIFNEHYTKGTTEFTFNRTEIETKCNDLGIELPKNLGDLIYTYRYRSSLPNVIQKTASKNREWMILPAGRSKYKFIQMDKGTSITPNALLAVTEIPDATPGIISMFALNDEQAILAKIRYNRLVDIFTRAACYSLQSHLRTTAKDIGQVETDEVYVGIDKSGLKYVIPVQAKGGRDELNIVQIIQDLAMCKEKFPELICRPVAAQFLDDNTIALFEFQEQDGSLKIYCEKHYKLVPAKHVKRA